MKVIRAILCVTFGLSFTACDKPVASHPPATPPPAATPKNAEQIWQDVSPSLIYVSARGIDGGVMQGSGFVVELDGKRLILTNRHVVKGAEKVSVGTDTKSLIVSSGYKIAANLDLAVVECPADVKAPALPRATRTLNPGAEVVALGFPLGIGKIITRGIVSSVEDGHILFDAPISSGNSGGPVVNHFGEVVAVATMGSKNTGTTIVQNLNLGIRVTAIPKLPLFIDPLLRLSAVADRIREVEAFIERGYREEDWFDLLWLLTDYWMRENNPEPNKPPTEPEKAKRFQERVKAARQRFDTGPGKTREAVERYVAFLKECERRIESLPAAFSGLGNDPLLASFLREIPDGGWFASSDAPLNATPELFPKLARISADHWLAVFEDHRFRVEWALLYSPDIPSPPNEKDFKLAETAIRTIKTERPSIRLRSNLTGDRATDLKSYFSTMQEWESRMDVYRDKVDILGLSSKVDAVRAETARGEFLALISSFRQRLATVAAERGELERAIALLRIDLSGRASSARSGSLIGEFLALSGRFEDAWKAYANHYSERGGFNAFKLEADSLVHGLYDYRLNYLVKQGFVVEGLRTHGFSNHPAILENARVWNEQVAFIEGRKFTSLPTLGEVISSQWFQSAPRLTRIRLLYYFRAIRSLNDEPTSPPQSGTPANRVYLDKLKEFNEIIGAHPEIRQLWIDVTEGDTIPPLF